MLLFPFTSLALGPRQGMLSTIPPIAAVFLRSTDEKNLLRKELEG